MAKEDKKKYWTDLAAEDLSLAEYIFKGGRWLYTAFMCHQAIEKMLKAYWVYVRDDEPPYTHEHKRLAGECGLWEEMTEKQQDFIELIRPMNIEARYPDYKRNIAKSLNEASARHILEQTKEIIQWIHQKF